jgi:hypothetical protein
MFRDAEKEECVVRRLPALSSRDPVGRTGPIGPLHRRDGHEDMLSLAVADHACALGLVHTEDDQIGTHFDG